MELLPFFFTSSLVSFLLLSFLVASLAHASSLSRANATPVIFLVLYSFTFFFANFGPNATTFIVPAEVFATKFRSTLHGVSSAAGRLGGIVGVFGFGALQLAAGTRTTLVALAAVNFAGMLFTVFIPETKQMRLDDASSKSMSYFGRKALKGATCPLYEAESRSASNTSASYSDDDE